MDTFDHFEILKLKCKQFVDQVKSDIYIALNRIIFKKSIFCAYAIEICLVEEEYRSAFVNIHRQVWCKNLDGPMYSDTNISQLVDVDLRILEEDVNIMLGNLSCMQMQMKRIPKLFFKFYWKNFVCFVDRLEVWDLEFAIKNLDGHRFVDDGSLCKILANYFNPIWTHDAFWYWWTKLGLEGFKGIESIGSNNVQTLKYFEDFFD